MNFKLVFLYFLFAFTTNFSFGQTELDSIILLNGRVYRGVINDVNENFLQFQETSKKGATFNSEILNYRIFSYTQKGQETILYKQNESGGNYLTVDAARNATLGSYDARQTFRPRAVFWSSLALSYSASLFDTYLPQSTVDNPDYIGPHTSGGMFKSSPSVFPFLLTPVITVSWGLPSFRIKENQIIQTHLINNESYYRGFHRVAKQKRMLAALKGSLIGIGAGLVTYAVFKP